ncbi:hypothetical protein myaer102_05730 [Microcystis viridis NIES-102]|uniref:Uncharacterized protein n=1 Tax=Microcystis viridis NIES-102 TaxID=213615 RepID=A0A3G9JC00_MICVR|nr:hypothetical protein [Microcystis viridis]BBH38086.1 hypothetical protein myaer102_05730 [Microcystis viridis NIES-102]
MSVAHPLQKRNIWKNQPFKGLLFIGIIAVVSLVFELIFTGLFALDVNEKLVYTIFQKVCHTW